jgi:hypothetical protein
VQTEVRPSHSRTYQTEGSLLMLFKPFFPSEAAEPPPQTGSAVLDKPQLFTQDYTTTTFFLCHHRCQCSLSWCFPALRPYLQWRLPRPHGPTANDDTDVAVQLLSTGTAAAVTIPVLANDFSDNTGADTAIVSGDSAVITITSTAIPSTDGALTQDGASPPSFIFTPASTLTVAKVITFTYKITIGGTDSATDETVTITVIVVSAR